jgi:hypothetical protein
MKKRDKKLQLNRETVRELGNQMTSEEKGLFFLTQCTIADTSCPRTTC